MTRVDLIVFEGAEELDVFGPLEVLKAAEQQGAGLSVRLVTLRAPRELQMALRTHLRVDEAPDARSDVIVIPGGGWISRDRSGAFAEAQQGDLPAWIARAHETGAVIASVCTGAMLVAAAGLSKGRAMTTHAAALEDLRGAGAEVVRSRVVDDGDIVSAGGITAGIDLGLWLIERFCGAQAAVRVETELECERRGVVYRRPRALEHSRKASAAPAVERSVSD
jgi:transcriptional regulator GlxA family with amidase domain